jgi:acyl-CoA thioester hydrolase
LSGGRSDFLRLVGVGHAGLLERADPAAFVITRMEIDFRRAARIDDALLVRTTYDRVRGPRLLIGQTITRGEEVIAAAQVQAACIDLQGRPRKPPPGWPRHCDPTSWPRLDFACDVTHSGGFSNPPNRAEPPCRQRR